MTLRPSMWDALQRVRTAANHRRSYALDPRELAGCLDPIAADACRRCAQRLWDGACPSLGCRRGWLSVDTTHVALGYKRGDVQRLLLAAKDRVESGAVALLARLLAGFLLGIRGLQSYDLILPVPFHPGGLRGRPAHPLTAIYLDAAPALRARFSLDDLAPPFVVQMRDVPSLRRQTERERWRTVHGAFALGFKTRMLRGARIAVLDDVMTTGATVSECARVLLDAGGAAAVDAIVLLRQPWAPYARTHNAHHLAAPANGFPRPSI